MIFCGDIALPNSDTVLTIPTELCQKKWFVNLEGGLIENRDVMSTLKMNRVFNNVEAIEGLLKLINIAVFSLANNHIQDCSQVGDTVEIIDKWRVKHIGAGINFQEAEKSLHFIEGQGSIDILSFGWDVIKCPIATYKQSGVNPYEKNHVIKTVEKALKHSEKVICFFHWGYELEEYPLPYDRALAHHLIEMGVKAVIGCHAHRVQQIEFYKGCPIVYGLGNFLFPHKVFWNGRLKFPDFTKKELAFEITESGDFFTHWFNYDIIKNQLTYEKSEQITPSMSSFEGFAQYSGMSSSDYDVYFKKNRYHKKLIPVFLSNESKYMYLFKSRFVKYRAKVIDMLVKMNLKAKKR